VPLKPDHTGQSENLFALLRQAVLDGPGSTPPRVRHAVAYATRDELAHELRDYVTTLRDHAYRATDAQVAELLATGWSEDQVYELTVAAALGAGQRRLDAGLAALARYGDSAVPSASATVGRSTPAVPGQPGSDQSALSSSGSAPADPCPSTLDGQPQRQAAPQQPGDPLPARPVPAGQHGAR
jgi:hypothetical protein